VVLSDCSKYQRKGRTDERTTPEKWFRKILIYCTVQYSKYICWIRYSSSRTYVQVVCMIILLLWLLYSKNARQCIILYTTYNTQCSTLLYYTLLYNALLWSVDVTCWASGVDCLSWLFALHCIALHCTALHCTAWLAWWEREREREREILLVL
jgi:hypothetical protein